MTAAQTKCSCSENWKTKYAIVEKMLIRRYSWSHGTEWATKLIRQDVKDQLKKVRTVRS